MRARAAPKPTSPSRRKSSSATNRLSRERPFEETATTERANRKTMEKRPALGKGLSALIPDAADALATPRASLDVDIDQLEPNQYQPRVHIDDARLEDLARSIQANGVIQPIVVRKLEGS